MSSHMKLIIGLSLLMFVPILWHFGTVLGYFGTAPTTRDGFFMRIGILVVFFIIASGLIAGRMAAIHGEDVLAADEREHLIEIKAERNGSWTLGAGLVAIMWFAFTPLSPMAIANMALAILTLSEAVKITSGLVYLKGRL